MRLTVQPENPLEAIALQTRKELQPFLLVMLGMGGSHAVIAGVRLGVIDAFQAKPQTTAQLANALQRSLSGSLDGFGFVIRKNNLQGGDTKRSIAFDPEVT